MTRPDQLVSFRPSKPSFVGIDSDGCAFDSMEIKWKEAFIPRAIEHFGLQPISRFARAAIEFVNLYSTSRGTNRFFGIIESLDWLEKHPGVRARAFAVPRLEALRRLCAANPQPTNGDVKKLVDATGDAELAKVLRWSESVNADIKRMVHGVPPFPFLRECLQRLASQADIMVVSSTPVEALEREWQEHGIAQHITLICGQETGSKKQVLSQAAAGYERDRVLMIGDAPGDRKAAQSNDARFYPIMPGAEEDSWQRFHDEALDRFLAGGYAGTYEQGLIDRFNALLPAQPAWL
jgi:hypothetical protein